jgi:hypothetical protein
METQINNKLNYLDITIENMNNTLTFEIYRKPTATSLIIHNNSCHPTEHKHAAIRYMTNRLNKYPISTNTHMTKPPTAHLLKKTHPLPSLPSPPCPDSHPLAYSKQTHNAHPADTTHDSTHDTGNIS